MDEDLFAPNLIPALRDVLRALVEGDYAALEADGRAGRVRAVDLARVVNQYPATLVEPPEDAFRSERNASAALVEGDDPYWDMDVRLWTAEEGRSNLTLRLTARQTDEGYRVQISDLLVPRGTAIARTCRLISPRGTLMNTAEALGFLARHQPMPDDETLDEGTLKEYDEVREFFLDNYDERCVDLLLGSFGDGMGFGVYQLVDATLRRYPAGLVKRALEHHLKSPHRGVRIWSLQIAMEYPDPALMPHIRRLLLSGDSEERLWAANNIDLSGTAADRERVEAALEQETDSDTRGLLEGWLARHPAPE